MSTPRIPLEAPPGRMAPLARLPVFLSLAGRRAVVVGSHPGLSWKVELLEAAGATVDVRGSITPDDLGAAALVIGGCESDEDAAALAATARGCGVPVNIIDKPAHSDFTFGAIVNRSPLVIGISTDGAAPVFAQAVRARIEATVPAVFSVWAETAKRWRKAVQTSGLSFEARRRFWHLFTARALRDPHAAPTATAFDTLLAAARRQGPASEAGSVTLVGAGPGDPELLTLRAVRALQDADVILIDDLVAPGVLDFARREARKLMVGKTGNGPSCKQEDINAMMVSLAKQGRRVVRLKGGDPMIFGRAGEEIEACRAAGVACEVVPGISAAQGAAARLQLSLTERNVARRLQYVTGHGHDGHLPTDIDWASIADPVATTAIYMPGRTLAEFVEKAMAAGLDAATPALAIINATRPQEVTIAGSIADLPGRVADHAPEGPMLVLLGRVTCQRRHSAIRSRQTA